MKHAILSTVAASAILSLTSAQISAAQMNWGLADNTYSILNFDLLSLQLKTTADWAWATVYESGDDEVNQGWHYESYAVRMWSNATFFFDFEALKSYKSQVKITLNFFDLVPYKQMFKWYRPAITVSENFNFWDAEVSGLFTVKFLTVETKFTENMRTLKYSLADLMVDPTVNKIIPSAITDINTDATYANNDAISWTDKLWGFDLIKFFGYDLSTYPYYGKNKKYFTFSLLNEANNSHTNELLIDLFTAISNFFTGA